MTTTMTRNPNRQPSTLSTEQLDAIQAERDAIENGDETLRNELYSTEIDSVYEYAHNLNEMGDRIDRIEKMNAAMGIEADDHGWADPEVEGHLDGGPSLVALAEKMHAADNYELSPEEQKFLEYEDSVIAREEARASIDQEKLLTRYPGESIEDSLLQKVTEDREKRKTLRQQHRDGTLPQSYRGNPQKLGGIIKNQGITRRYLANNQALEDYGDKLYAAIEAKNADPADTDAATAYHEALRDATRAERMNKAVEVTFAGIASARAFRNEEYTSPAIIERQNRRNNPGDQNASQPTGDTEDTTGGRVIDRDGARGTQTPADRPARQGTRGPGGNQSNSTGPGRQTSAGTGPGRNSQPAGTGDTQPAGDSGETETTGGPTGQTQEQQSQGETEPEVESGTVATIRREARQRAEREGAGAPEGTAETQAPANAAAAERQALEARLLKGQQMRVQNAATRLARSGRRRSRFENVMSESDEHLDFRSEVFQLMQMERPEFFSIGQVSQNKEQLKALKAEMDAYVTAQYNLVTQETVDGMAGETDPKKRKKNNMKLRLASTAVGFALGGPAGAAIAASVAIGVTKALDHEVKGREELRNAVNTEMTELATDEYIDSLGNPNEFNPAHAFEAATLNLREQYEQGVVIARNKRITGAATRGVLWGAGTYLGLNQAAGIIDYTFGLNGNGNFGGEFRHTLSTLDNPAGHPGYDYIPGNKPVSLSVLQWIFNNPAATLTATAAGAAATTAYMKARQAAINRSRQ